MEEQNKTNFDHLVHIPAAQQQQQAVMTELLDRSQAIVTLRTTKAQQQAATGVTVRSLLQDESRLGARIFGAVKTKEERSFFCLDHDTWIWYEAWFDPAQRRTVNQTTRYELNQKGVLKFRQGANYQYLDGAELENFVNATKAYYNVIKAHIYN